MLFDMIIGENICFVLKEGQAATQGQIEEAARATNIHKCIADLPDGYNTRVSDKGSQKNAITCSLIRKPKALLLDKAISVLEFEHEKFVQTAINNIISEGHDITITTAHRLSALQNTDLIYAIKSSRIIVQETHEELLKLKGEYAALVRQRSAHAN